MLFIFIMNLDFRRNQWIYKILHIVRRHNYLHFFIYNHRHKTPQRKNWTYWDVHILSFLFNEKGSVNCCWSLILKGFIYIVCQNLELLRKLGSSFEDFDVTTSIWLCLTLALKRMLICCNNKFIIKELKHFLCLTCCTTMRFR